MSTIDHSFHSANVTNSKGGIRGAVGQVLEKFLRLARQNARYGNAAVVVDVMRHENGAYFAVVLAGPFPNEELIKPTMVHAAEKIIDEAVNLRREPLK